MKIAIDGRCLAASVAPGQAARYTQNVIGQLARRGIQPEVIYCVRDPVPPNRLVGARAVALGGAGWLWEQVSLPRFLNTGNFDLLHIPMQNVRTPLLSRCPVLTTFHCGHSSAVDDEACSGAPARVRRRRVRHTIFVPSFCMPFFSPPSANVTVVAPIEADDCSPTSDKRANSTALPVAPIQQPYLLARDCGDGTTDLKLIIAAFRQVRLTFPRLQLVVVCRAIPPVHILEFVGQCGLLLDDDVAFVPDSAGLFLELSGNAELGIAPGNEGECTWVVPAMARGLEFVCSQAGCAARVVGTTGRIAERPDPSEFACAIAYLLKAGDRRQRAEFARSQAQCFEWTGGANGTLDVYAALAAKRKRQPRRPIGEDPVPDQVR
jgi:hypothetical protein